MAVDDTWYLKTKDADGNRVPSSRHGGKRKRYRVYWPDGKGGFPEKFFDRKTDADRFHTSIRADINRDEYIDPDAGKITFREYAEKWRTGAVHAETTQNKIESDLRLHVYPVIGDRPLKAILRSEIQSLVKGMNLAPATVEVVYRFVQAVFKMAVADRRISAINNPCVGITLINVDRPRITPLPTEAVSLWMQLIDPRHRGLVELAATSGLRGGEMFGLEVERINNFAKTIDVARQIVLVNGQAPFMKLPKGDKTRTVWVGEYGMERLKEYMKEFPPVEVEIVDKSTGRDVTRTAKLVFTTARKNVMRRNMVQTKYAAPALDKVCAQLLASDTEVAHQLRAALKNDRNGFHLLRHYFASMLIANGASPPAVQQMLGHASATETMETYVGLWPSEPERIRGAVDKVWLAPRMPAGDQRSLRLVT